MFLRVLVLASMVIGCASTQAANSVVPDPSPVLRPQTATPALAQQDVETVLTLCIAVRDLVIAAKPAAEAAYNADPQGVEALRNAVQYLGKNENPRELVEYKQNPNAALMYQFSKWYVLADLDYAGCGGAVAEHLTFGEASEDEWTQHRHEVCAAVGNNLSAGFLRDEASTTEELADLQTAYQSCLKNN